MIHLAFLAFLSGLAALAVPVILHFLRRKPSEEEAFPSFMFLGSSTRVAQRRNSLRKWLVLLLRCLALAALALAFAWPFVPAFDARPELATLLLWDDSLSMKAAPYADELMAKALAEARKASPQTPVLIGAVGRRVVWSGRFSSVPSELEGFLKLDSRNIGSSSFRSALEMAAARLRGIDAKRRRLIVLTDKQAVPWRDFAGGVSLPAGTETLLIGPAVPGFDNAAIRSVRVATPFSKEGSPVGVDVELANYSKKPLSGELKLFVGADEAASKPVSLRPLETAQIRMTVRPAHLRPEACRAVFECPDDLPQDGVRHFALNPSPDPLVLATPSQERADYLKTAYQASASSRAADFKTLKPADFSDALLAKASLLILREGFPANSEAERLVAKRLAEGGAVCAIWRDDAEMRGFLLRRGVSSSANGKARKGVHFGEIDFESPLFKRFLEAKVGGLFETRFKNPASLTCRDGAARVHASFDDGRPAVLELPVGSGRLFVIASSLDKASGDWPLSPAFLPFWRELLADCLRNSSDDSSLDFALGAPASLSAPDGSPADLSKPGCVKLVSKGRELLASVNVPASESDPATLQASFALDKAALAGVASDGAAPQVAEPKESSSLERANEAGTPLWWPTLLLALLLFIAEMALANRTAL